MRNYAPSRRAINQDALNVMPQNVLFVHLSPNPQNSPALLQVKNVISDMSVKPSTSSTLESLQPSLTSSFIRKNSLSLSTLILPIIPSMIFPSWASRPFTKNMIQFFANANLFGSQNFSPYNRTVWTPTHKMHRLRSTSVCNSVHHFWLSVKLTWGVKH